MPTTDQRHLHTDLRLVLRQRELRPVYVIGTATTTHHAPRPRRVLDLLTIDGGGNLAQAILVRLLTPRGELEALAHPEYGSRLHELIGQPNSETTRNLARLYILDSLRAEPRIEKVVAIDVTASGAPDEGDLVRVTLRVQPVGGGRPLTLGPLGLELKR